jgi:hypothetical protein
MSLAEGYDAEQSGQTVLITTVRIEGDLVDLQSFTRMEDQSVILRKLRIDSPFKTITDVSQVM